MRTNIIQNIDNETQFKKQLLNWAQKYNEIVFLDSNESFNQKDDFSNYSFMLAVDALTSLKTDYHNAFKDLNEYQQTTRDWIFGYLSYDLKNNVEDLTSKNFDGLSFPDLYFFQPKKLFLFKDGYLEIKYLNSWSHEIENDLKLIGLQKINNDVEYSKLQIKPRISKKKYLEKVSKLLDFIKIGDIYEINLCMEFYVKNAKINPLKKFEKLNEISRAPFSVFFKNNKNYLLSASPERYLKKDYETIFSQPIKGTSKRFSNQMKDLQSKINLQNDEKERSENIMIVDLVRNDLSKTAQKGSVKVTEFCQVHSFSQVHQMISTITSKLKSEFSVSDVLKTTFPMGSMTGAPKISAMKIIEDIEKTKRGLYSGAFGYINPSNNFDFNVVIRSILYNADNQYLSFSVGSAITSLSIPENEYNECLIKAKAMKKIL